MSALTNERDTPARDGRRFSDPVGAAKKIFAGSIVVLSATGFAESGTTATGKIARGRASQTVDNTNGAAGDLAIEIERGCFRFGNDSSITRANIGATCYIVDDQTVALTDGSGARSAAGTIRDVDSVGVWVEFT